MQGLSKDSLHKTLQTVLTTMQQLKETVQQNGEHGDSSNVIIETLGKGTKKRTKQLARDKKTVLNLSGRRLSDDDFILMGKWLSFCPKTRSHDKIKLAEELFE